MEDEDKRAEAMKQAIAEDEEESAKEKKTITKGNRVKTSSGNSKGSGRKFDISGILDSVKDFFKPRSHKILVGGIGAGLVIILAVIAILSSVGNNTDTVKEMAYEQTNSILCTYKTGLTSPAYAYDAYVEITNTGEAPITVSDGVMRVQDEWENGIDVNENTWVVPSVINPGESGYMYSPFESALNIQELNEDQEYYLRAKYTVSRADEEQHRYPTTDPIISGEGDSETISLAVTNDLEETADEIHVAVITYQKDGYASSISTTSLTNVTAGSSKEVEIDKVDTVWAWKDEGIASVRVYAY